MSRPRFRRIAARAGDLASRTTSVLARIAWPGKPGEAALVPLTPSEQKRFDEGQVVYRNLCQACHQADGRGQDKLAPPLVGSVLTLARADVPARVLLQGKEGAIGLMPPIGTTLSDDQIASVLTYVRREWGQAGAPVDVEAVRAVRALTSASHAALDRQRADGAGRNAEVLKRGRESFLKMMRKDSRPLFSFAWHGTLPVSGDSKAGPCVRC